MNAAECDVTVKLTNGDRPMTSEEARMLLKFVEPTEMQDDLRAWADEIEAGTHHFAPPSDGEPA